MRILEKTDQQLTLEDRPPIDITIYIIVCVLNFLLVFFFKIIDIPIWIFALLNLLIIGFFASKINYANCVIQKKQNTIYLRVSNIFNQTRLQKVKMNDIKKIDFVRYRVSKNYIYKITFVLKSNKTVSLTPNPIMSKENAENILSNISTFLELDCPKEIENIGIKSRKKEIIVFYFFIIFIPLIYLSFYPGKTLIDSSKQGDLVAVKNYLNAGGDPNVRNLLGNNALFFAADRGHENIVRLLIERGASVNVYCMNSTPLHQAILEKDIVIIKMLVEHGADVNALTKDDKKTPLDYAMLVNDSSIASYLKELGAVHSVSLIHEK